VHAGVKSVGEAEDAPPDELAPDGDEVDAAEQAKRTAPEATAIGGSVERSLMD